MFRLVNVVGSRQDNSILKPKGFEKYLTIGELCREVDRTRDRILQLERAGRLPKPIRSKVGRLRIRLYSPEDVRAIKRHFKNAKPGRPKGA